MKAAAAIGFTTAMCLLAAGLLSGGSGADLEALAAAASELNRWEFMFVLAPLPVPNGAGAAINPIAVF